MKIGWIEFWIAALCTYRITILLSRDLGPWRIFARLRAIDRCSKLLKCPFCVSVYVGSLTSFALFFCGYSLPWPLWFMLALAFSSVSIALDRTFTADYNP